MNFEDMPAASQALAQQLAANQISTEQFQHEVQKLRAQRRDGGWYQINAQDGSWLKWDGQQWMALPQDVRATPQHAASAEPQEKQPETLWELAVFVLKGMLKLRQIALMVVLVPAVAFIVMVLHTFFLVVVNEGFNADSSTNFLILRTLAVKGKVISATALWGLFSAVATLIFYRVIGRGWERFVQEIKGLPEWVKGSFQRIC